MGTLERRQREKEQRRMEILSAAREIFFAKGLEGSTMDEIADKAELSKGTLYLYFKSKDELYVSLLSEGTEIFTNMMLESISEDMKAEDKLRSVGNAYYRFYDEYPQYFKILFLLQHGEFSDDKVDQDIQSNCMFEAGRSLNLIESIIIEGGKNGEFTINNSWQATLFVWASANGVFTIAAEKHHEFMKEFDTKALLDFTMERIISSLR